MQYLVERTIKYYKQLVIISLIIAFIKAIILVIKGLSIIETGIGMLMSIILLFICYGMIYLMLGLQLINPLCPKSVYIVFAYFFIVSSSVFLCVSVVNDLLVTFIVPIKSTMPYAFTPASAGLLILSTKLLMKADNKDKK